MISNSLIFDVFFICLLVIDNDSFVIIVQFIFFRFQGVQVHFKFESENDLKILLLIKILLMKPDTGTLVAGQRNGFSP